MMKTHMRTLPVLVLLAAIMAPVTAETNAADQNILTYTVSDQGIAVISAVTPYDSQPEVRNAFLKWFKRGFDTVLSGSSPLMIEWDTTAKGRAGQRGYDLGMGEAEKFMQKKASSQSLQTTSIPPL